MIGKSISEGKNHISKEKFKISNGKTLNFSIKSKLFSKSQNYQFSQYQNCENKNDKGKKTLVSGVFSPGFGGKVAEIVKF